MVIFKWNVFRGTSHCTRCLGLQKSVSEKPNPNQQTCQPAPPCFLNWKPSRMKTNIKEAAQQWILSKIQHDVVKKENKKIQLLPDFKQSIPLNVMHLIGTCVVPSCQTLFPNVSEWWCQTWWLSLASSAEIAKTCPYESNSYKSLKEFNVEWFCAAGHSTRLLMYLGQTTAVPGRRHAAGEKAEIFCQRRSVQHSLSNSCAGH